MKNKLTLTEQEELFVKDCKLINLKYEYTPTALTMFSARCFQPRKESSKSYISEYEKRPPTRCKRSLIICFIQQTMNNSTRRLLTSITREIGGFFCF